MRSSSPLVGIDETAVQVLNEPGRDNAAKSYMWVFRGGDPDHPSRSEQIPLSFLNGYQDFSQTNGYNSYDAQDRQPVVTLVG